MSDLVGGIHADHDMPMPHLGECTGALERREKGKGGAYTVGRIVILIDLWTCDCYGHAHVQVKEAGWGACIQLIEIEQPEGFVDTIDGRTVTMAVRVYEAIALHVAPMIAKKRMAEAAAISKLN